MKVVSAIIVAAGEGRRFGSAKQFALIKGKPVIDWSLERLEVHEKIAETILVVRDERGKDKYFDRYLKLKAVVKGGEKRQDSVIAGFNQINPEKTGIVLVHDGVRPLVGEDLISRIIEAAEKWGAAIPVLPIEDTVKLVEGKVISRTLDRSKLFRVQTPQGFFYSILNEALKKAIEDGFYGTDEAALVERIGGKVFAVKGDSLNIKITDKEDLRIAEALIED